MSDTVLGQDLSNEQPEADSFNAETFVSENIGEGKQYATQEEALAALAKKAAHQDTFIETLKLEKQGVETEKEALAKQLEDAAGVEEILKAVNGEQINQPSGGDQTPATVSEDKIRTIISETLQAEKDASASQQQADKLDANREKAFEQLVKPGSEGGFGSKEAASEAVKRYVGESQERKDLLNRMGAYQPDAVAGFLKLQLQNENKMEGLGPNEGPSGVGQSPDNGLLTWAKAQQIKKDDPKLYRSRQFQMQMHKAADANPNFWK